MIPGFTKIVERRILNAQKKGEFDNLEGSGKPLKLDGGGCVSEELRLAMKAAFLGVMAYSHSGTLLNTAISAYVDYFCPC